ncbi:ABC transporter substrate-binding protein [Antrihabitans cavernicola]|uniref:ABC transporter substrate-binding protein n=1 Tax=Antrihabitans cavernicola TaxID=2495913 RepID=A0A5A7S7R4_9NOCA|nr:ABC transporter substrate-binding protein [Spelaeibacter cavernicola]KAA0021239.1 ABC transporter substrate-binding protein [Spelaeibacter cavernicola]
MRTRTTNTRGVRRCALALLATVAVLAPAACGSDSTDAKQESTETVSIKHSLGTTNIEGTPQRVVTIGSQWLDAAQALGVKPVGYVDTVSAMSGGTPAPWEPASLKESKALDAQGDLVEQVAALNPDLILVPGFLVDQATYDKLTKLAPTIANVGSGAVEAWDQQVDVLGKVLHKPDEAKKVVDDVNGKIEAVGTRYPGLKGKSFLTSFLSTPTQLMVLADPKDGSSTIFTRLGMVAPQNLVDQAAATGGRLALSPERVGDLTSDLLVATAAPGMEETFKQLPGYATLPAVQKNSVAFLDIASGSGLNTPSALSVPYLLDKLDPAFANAAK